MSTASDTNLYTRIEDLPLVLTIPDLCRVLRLSPRTIHQRIAEGGHDLPPELPGRGKHLWSRDVVAKWLTSETRDWRRQALRKRA